MQSLFSNKIQIEEEISLLEKKYREELSSGAVFRVLKSIRMKIRQLKNELQNASSESAVYNISGNKERRHEEKRATF